MRVFSDRLPVLVPSPRAYQKALSLVPAVMTRCRTASVRQTACPLGKNQHFWACPADKRRVVAEEFQLWTLKVKDDGTARLICDDGYGNIVFSKRIPFTDFSLSGIKLYCTAWKRPRYKAKTRFLTTVDRARKGGLESGHRLIAAYSTLARYVGRLGNAH